MTAEFGPHHEHSSHGGKELLFGGERFSEFLTGMGERCPEIREKKDGLLGKAQLLTEEYAVKPEFFRDKDHSIGLLFASALELEASEKQGKSPGRQDREQRLARNFATTLMGYYSDIHPFEDLRSENRLKPEERLTLFKESQNKPLSKELHTWLLSSEELEGTRRALQIQNGQEENFEVMVLPIINAYHAKALGNAAYVETLQNNGKSFKRKFLSDENNTLPIAWVSTIDEMKYMCVSEAIANILLHPDKIGFKDINTDKKNGYQDIAKRILRHEFVHTQGNIALINSYLGYLFEEFRADMFSKAFFPNDYPDIFRTVENVEKYQGFFFTGIMGSIPLAGAKDKPAFYATLAQKMGLVPAAMITGILPKRFADFHSPKSSREIFEALTEKGLRDEILLRMTEAEIEDYCKKDYLSAKQKADFRELTRAVKQRLG